MTYNRTRSLSLRWYFLQAADGIRDHCVTGVQTCALPILSLDTLMRAPGVLQTNEELADAEDFWPSVQRALGTALEMLVKMRVREGTHLRKDLAQRIGVMQKSVARVKKEAPLVQKRYRAQLLERIKTAGLDG